MAGFFGTPINLALQVPYKGQTLDVGGVVSADGVAALKWGVTPGGNPATAPQPLPVQNQNVKRENATMAWVRANPKTALALAAIAALIVWKVKS